MKRKDIIIIGAPRSGTNMLRNVLVSIPGIGSWPCDEINYIWRHGNIRYPSDEFTAQMATPAVKRYVKRKFSEISARNKADTIVEKTCANSLRVNFVDEILPHAKYVFIYRNGIDVVASAKKRWVAALDFKYILSKSRFVPASDLPYYGLRFLWNRLYKQLSGEKKLAYWGPAIDGMQEIIKTHSLIEVCGLQWKRCMEKADKELSALDDEKVIRVRYEDLVADPYRQTARILKFIGTTYEDENLKNSVSSVSSGSVGKGVGTLCKEDIDILKPLIGDTMKSYGYE